MPGSTITMVVVERQAEWIAQRLGRPELAPLAPDDISAMAALLYEEHHAAGTVIFKVGEAPTRVGIVRSGSVELSRTSNNRRIVLQVLRPGDAYLDLGVFLRRTAPYDAIALEDTLILNIDSVQFNRLLEQRPRLAYRWLTSVTSRLANYQERVAELLAGSLEAQIAVVLLRRADRSIVTLSQASLAELVGGQRTSVNRILKRLEEQNLVRAHYGQVEILDAAGLAAIAGLD